MPDGCLLPAALVMRWLERAAVRRVHLAALPPGNQVLPDLLHLGGVTELICDAAPLPVMRWEGAGGSRILVRQTGDETPSEEAPVHCGALPGTVGTAIGGQEALLGLFDLARLEDASAAVGAGDGAIWEALLTSTTWVEGFQRPPVSALTGRGGEGLGAWNPLALPRRCLVSLHPTTSRAPWSLIDDHGARYPVQPCEGALGPAWLVQVPLGPLGGSGLQPSDEPATGCQWEVSERVLDNGRVRVEFDALGQIARLCWDGAFADLSGPACALTIDGLALAGSTTISVLEDGPVRARVAVRRETAQGRLDLIYSLLAHEDHLRVSAAWSGEIACWLDHATAQRSADLHVAGEGARISLAQAASALRLPMPPIPGLRWASLADSAGRGIAAVSGRPLTMSAQAGHLRILVAPTATWALAAPRRLPGTMTLGQLAEHLAVPGRPLPAGINVPRPFRLAEPGGLVPLWIRRPPECTGELLLAEQLGARTRAWLLPATRPGTSAACWKVDAHGNRLAPCPLSPEGDGWQIDAAPGEILLVRWLV